MQPSSFTVGARMPCNPKQFIDEVPHYEARDGRVYISMGEHCLAMPISVFEAGCTLGKAAIAKWRVKQLDGGVFPIRRRK